MAVRFDSNADLERPQVCAVLMLMRTSEHASAQHGVMLPHTLMRLSGPWSALAEGCGAACTELYVVVEHGVGCMDASFYSRAQ